MDENKKMSSLDQYFSSQDKSSSSFFDHLSESGGSAMMTSVVASPSTQDLFEAASESMDGVVAATKSLTIDGNEEPVVCKIFAQEKEKGGAKSFFDVIGSGGGESSECPLNEWTEALSNFEGPFPSAIQGFEDATDSIWSSETDRTREAWIPCERTRRALIHAATSPSGASLPDPDLLTRPTIVQEEPLVDNVTQLLKHHFGEAEASKRKACSVLIRN